MFEDLLPPVDAGDSYLGQYGLSNAWVAWLLSRAPDLVAIRAPAFRNLKTEIAPVCPESPPFGPSHRMMIRREHFACYLHEHAVTMVIRPKYQRAPDGDVLSRIGEP